VPQNTASTPNPRKNRTSFPTLQNSLQLSIDSSGALRYHTVTLSNMRISTLPTIPAKKAPSISQLVLAIVIFSAMGAAGSVFSLATGAPAAHPHSAAVKTASLPPLEQKQFPQGTLYTLTVPKGAHFKVLPVLSKTLATIDSQIWQSPAGHAKPVFVINGGFFDPNNSLTISFVFQKGMLAGDPRINPQLVNNPKLIPYLPKIFNRPEFRVYLCQKAQGQFETQYDIAPHDTAIPKDCLLQDSLGAGPTLLPSVEGVAEGFLDYNDAGKLTRDPIGVCAKNARSAVGLTANGDVILMMGSQNPANPKSSGFTLADMASLLKARGAVKAMALDGGSSSSILYNNKPIFGRLGAKGELIKRPVKSVLMVVPRS
jgi:hypothetical protein